MVRRMRFDTKGSVQIIVVGAGGTGGWVIPHIYRICSIVNRQIDVVICDGDLVEEKNLQRQNFVQQDIGKNKAKVLAERYSAAFSQTCRFYPRFVEDYATLAGLIRANGYCDMNILIGAVDNNRSRQLFDVAFHDFDDLIYLDSGNGSITGQVVCGVRRNGRTVSAPLSTLYPDVLKPVDQFPSELSCADLSESEPQTIAANIMAATIMVTYLFNILVVGNLRPHSNVFSTDSISTSSRLPQKRKKHKTRKDDC